MKRIFFFLSPFAIIAIYYFFPGRPIPEETITKIVVHKSQREMEVYAGNKLLKTYSIALGKSPEGDKIKEGDKKTPEGHYIINDKSPNSSFHKNLGISYPDENDLLEAKRLGVSPGGQIKIHGLKSGWGFIGKFHQFRDWTAGCIAVTNEEMDELYNHVPVGTPIVINP